MAMMEDAVGLSGRNGTKDKNASDATAISHSQLVDGDHLIDDPGISDGVHISDSKDVDSTHVAAPELTHPGESQSNGLAERSVGIFEDHSGRSNLLWNPDCIIIFGAIIPLLTGWPSTQPGS